jgi:cation:H+ antiporter
MTFSAPRNASTTDPRTMALDIALLVASLLLILGCCAVFVNAVEQLGDSFNLHQGIVGSILAAVGTALPETIIPIIAIFFARGGHGHEIGIGAIAGAPFMLGTLAFFITGAAVIVFALLGRRKLAMTPDPECISRDLTFFLVFYGVAVATTFFHQLVLVKAIVAISLLLSYGIYLKWTINHECEGVDNVESLYLARFFKLPQNRFWIMCQVIFSLCMLVLGADYFIKYVQALSSACGVAPLVLSLIITPIATEMPEKLNSIIWVGKRKDTLALGNITGAMVFQSCFPVVFGMLFTSWDLRGITMLSAGLAIASALTIMLWVRIKKSLNPFILLSGGFFYAVLFGFMLFRAQ